MASQITNYQCPACTGPLHFASGSGKLACEYCGSAYDVAEIEALYAGQEEKAEAAFQETEAKGETGELGEEPAWDTSALQEDWGADSEGMKAYSCPSCGAELICDATTAATSCPYCGNNTIVPGQFGGTMKPDYVIPFKLDKKAAVAALKKHYSKKFFLPRAFSSGNHLEEVQGIYVPFWLFDAGAEADCRFHATRSHTHTDGDYRVTVTEHFDVRRSGTMEFERIPVDGSKKMPDDYMDSIEPFDYAGLKSFSTAYLPGYLADKYDVTAQESMERADRRCHNSAFDQMRRDISGYEVVNQVGGNVRLHRGKVHYVLMPVCTLRTRWKNQDYLFMMNGQTGKMVGDLPVSNGKVTAFFSVLAVTLSGLMLWSGLGQTIARIFLA